MTVYTSEVDNTCKLKLHLPLSIINNQIFPELGENYEISGVINCDNFDKVSHVDKHKGDSDSVYTPNNVINFHTHPISAYNQGDTVWGWPSGEDIRETIKFAFNGNKAHLVFTVEGLYTIQVSPCKIRKMKELLTDSERGILIFMIEEYFKSTHNFRPIPEVNKLAKKNIMINPYSFVHFINTFDLNNLLSTAEKTHISVPSEDISSIGHSGIHSEKFGNIMKYSGLRGHQFSKIPNGGFPEVQDSCIVTSSIKNYVTPDDFESLRTIDKKGQEDDFSGAKINDLIKKLKMISSKFNETKCNIVWNNNPNAWFFVNFFPTEYYVQAGYRDGQRFVGPNKSDISLLTLAHEPFIRIFSTKKEGCSINTIGKKNNFKLGKPSYSMGEYAVNRYSFGNKELTSSQIMEIIRSFKGKGAKALIKHLRKYGLSKDQIEELSH
jgi:hypothetical protein